ncbi:MAG: hypothetical protein AB8F95_13665 [Bacteroidia bacterium]
MTEVEKDEVFERANRFLNKEGFKEEMIAINTSLKEYDLCYSLDWCEKKQLSLPPSERKIYLGAGRVLVSKINDMVSLEGSAPSIDWIRRFELEIQDLEEYWVVEIAFEKHQMGALKTLLKCSTPELMAMMDDNSKLIVEGEDYEVKRLQKDVSAAGVQSEVKLLTRKKE